MTMHKINSKNLASLLLLIEGVVIQLENNHILVQSEKSLVKNLKIELQRYLNNASKEMEISRYFSSQQYAEIQELISMADKLIAQASDAKLIVPDYRSQYESMKVKFKE